MESTKLNPEHCISPKMHEVTIGDQTFMAIDYPVDLEKFLDKNNIIKCVSVWTDPSFDKYRKEELKITYMPWNNL